MQIWGSFLDTQYSHLLMDSLIPLWATLRRLNIVHDKNRTLLVRTDRAMRFNRATQERKTRAE